jgi:hypothetical protein
MQHLISIQINPVSGQTQAVYEPRRGDREAFSDLVQRQVVALMLLRTIGQGETGW